ncbi:MAG: O-antigen ligase family protein [Thermodesulfobacteriota bacterium]|jgi:O-antigen ligase
MDAVTIIICIGIGLFTVVAITLWSIKRYEVAVFLVGLSPWLSALFIPPYSEDLLETTLGSYLRIGIVLWMGMVGFIQYIRFRLSKSENVPLHFGLFGLFLLFALISTSYSIDPFYTFVRSCAFIALFGFLIGLHGWLQNDQRLARLLHTLFLLVSFFIVINLLSMITFSDRVWWGDGNNRFQGLWSHPNTLGSVCMISYPVLQWEYSRGTPLKKLMVIVLFVLLACLHLLTGSRASIAVAFLGLSVWFLIQRKRRNLILALGLAAVATFLIVQFRPSSFQREEGTGVIDLTGRQEFWRGSLILMKERPLLGYGYGVEGKIWEDPRFYGNKETLWSGSVRASLHNGYFSIAIGMGTIIFFMWCLILLVPLWKSMRQPSNDFKALAVTLLMMGMVLNFFEGVITEGRSFVAILFWIAWVFAGRLPTGEKGHAFGR